MRKDATERDFETAETLDLYAGNDDFEVAAPAEARGLPPKRLSVSRYEDVTEVSHLSVVAALRLREKLVALGHPDVAASYSVPEVLAAFLDATSLAVQSVLDCRGWNAPDAHLAALDDFDFGAAARAVVEAYNEVIAQAAVSLEASLLRVFQDQGASAAG